jgi:hypothetical protein
VKHLILVSALCSLSFGSIAETVNGVPVERDVDAKVSVGNSSEKGWTLFNKKEE